MRRALQKRTNALRDQQALDVPPTATEYVKAEDSNSECNRSADHNVQNGDELWRVLDWFVELLVSRVLLCASHLTQT
jgi:hypothetical protein